MSAEAEHEVSLTMFPSTAREGHQRGPSSHLCPMYVTSKRAFYYRFTGTASQVRDSIRRLEEEIAKMTKIIFAAILDDAVVTGAIIETWQ